MLKAIELDFGVSIGAETRSAIEIEIIHWLDEFELLKDTEFEIVQEHGPAGGNPVVRFTATQGVMERLIEIYDGENGEVEYLLDQVVDA